MSGTSRSSTQVQLAHTVFANKIDYTVVAKVEELVGLLAEVHHMDGGQVVEAEEDTEAVVVSVLEEWPSDHG